MGFVCFFQLGSVRFFVKFHCYNIRHCPMEAVGNCRICGRFYLLCFWNLQEKITFKSEPSWRRRSFLLVVRLQKNSHKGLVCPWGKQSCAFSSSSLFFQKSFFENYKLLQILVRTEKIREAIINVWYFINVQCSFTDPKRYIE